MENPHSITCFGILHPKSPLLSSENNLYFALPISRGTFFFVDKMMKGILSSFISSICFNIPTFAFLLPLRRVDISDFPQTRSAKLQRPSNEEDEQQPLSVYIWAKKTLNFFLIKLRITVRVSDDNCCKPQNVPGRNHDQSLLRWWHFCCRSTNENFHFLGSYALHKELYVRSNLGCVSFWGREH